MINKKGYIILFHLISYFSNKPIIKNVILPGHGQDPVAGSFASFEALNKNTLSMKIFPRHYFTDKYKTTLCIKLTTFNKQFKI